MRLTTVDESEYKTSDLGLAAALNACGFRSINIDRSNPQRAVFIFPISKDLEDAVDSFWKDELQLNARTYFDSIKSVKSRMYGDY